MPAPANSLPTPWFDAFEARDWEVNGTRLHARVPRTPPDGRPALLLLHGFPQSHVLWHRVVQALQDRFYVVMPDLRGYGDSAKPTGLPDHSNYSKRALAQDMVALMDALGVAKAHMAGLSMGGMICQYLGANYPDRVLSLGLCDTASEMPPRSLWEERFAIARKDGIAGLVDGTIKRWFVAGFPEKEPAKIAAVREMILATPLEGYIGCASAVRDMAQTTMLLKIKAPTQIMVGREDPACTVDQSTVLLRMIPHAQMHIIDDAAHLSNIEKPEEFNRVLRNFLDRNAG